MSLQPQPAIVSPSIGPSSTRSDSTSQSPLPKRARSSYETLFFTLTPQKAAEKTYDIIVIGTGIGGGVVAGDLFESNSRLGIYGKSVLVIEIGDLPFHSHCLNSSRPTGFDEDRGQQNDTFFSLFRDKYKFSADTNVKDWNGGPMYNLGGRSAAWGLFSPRIHDEILKHQFAPGTKLHDELVRTWYKAAEDLMGLSLPTTTPIHQNLIDRLNIKNNFENNRNVQWQWGRIASEFHDSKNFDFARGAYSTIDKLIEIAMSKRRKDGVLEEHKNWSIILRSEVRSIIWRDDDPSQAAGVVVRDENGSEIQIKLKTDANGKVLDTSNIILAAGSVQSPAILLRSGKKNFLESNGGLHLTDHDIFAKGYSFHYLNPGDREQVGSMKIQTYVRLGNDIAKGDIALANFSIDADSFLPKSFMPSQFYRNESPPKFIAAFIRPAPLNKKNTIELDAKGEPIVTMHRDPLFSNSHKHVVELKKLTKEAMEVLKKALSIEIHGTENDKDDEFFKPLGLGGVAHELGTIPMPGRPDEPSCLDENLKLRDHKGIYVCDLSVFPYSPEVNPTLALAALALRLSREQILPRLPFAARDIDSVYVMNQTGDKIQVFITNIAGVESVDNLKWETERQTLEPGEYAVRKRKNGVLESVMVYKLALNLPDVFVPDPTVYVARPGAILTI